MQGQDNTSNEMFYLDCGSSRINLQSDRNNDFVHDGHHVLGWTAQSTSAVNHQAPLRFQDLLAEAGFLSSSASGPGTLESVVERHPQPMIPPSQNGVNMSLGNGEFTNRPFPLQQGSSSALSQNIDLNAVCASHVIDANQNPFASDTSNSGPLVISSGIAGYVAEENEGREGCTLNGRRLPCKRRAPEYDSRELSAGETSRSIQQAVTNQINASARLNLSTPVNNVYSEELGPRIVPGIEASHVMHQPPSAAGAISDIHQTLGVVGEAENSQRNIRLRRTVNQQDLAPTNLAAWAPANSHAQLPSQPSVLFPYDRLPNTNLVRVQPTPTTIHPTTSPHLSVTAPNFSETLQPVQWNALIRSRAVPPSNAFTVNGGEALLLDDNSSNNSRNLIVPQEFQWATSEYILTNLNSVPGTNTSGNVASSSRNNPVLHVHHSMPPPLVLPQANVGEQYAPRISDNVVNHSESQGQGSYCLRHLGFPIDPRQRNAFERVASARPFWMPLRPGLTGLAGRQTGIQRELALRSLVAAQRRSRLVSEVRTALALVRRGGSLQFEDVMVIDRSVLYDVPEEPDVHEDMRLDVDAMSYEELLALEDRIGNVSTGLSEDAIQANMKRRKYQAIAAEAPSADEPCCICQEDYVDGEDLGKLDCAHDFHFNCIKQWLIQKNNCPICKLTGLAI